MQVIIKVKNEKEYIKKGKKYKWPKNPFNNRCPRCKNYCKIYKHGYYERYYINLYIGMKGKIYIQRYFCTKCLKTISLIPVFCIKKFVLGFEHILKAVYQILRRTVSIEKILAIMNKEYDYRYISKQQYYNYLNRFIDNIPLIESFIRQKNVNVEFKENSKTKKERVMGLLKYIKNEFTELNNFLYKFYQKTNKTPITLSK